jgi:hypothetical protein
MQAARSPTLAEATLDALAADLTVPHARPLVDLERDEYDYSTVEVGDSTTAFTRPFERIEEETKPRTRFWNAARVSVAIATLALGFGLGAGVSLLI